ncbi:MAG TPA: hypothetical protein VHQ90_09205 [Thermoanaerobaculia bacterium]|nr:hypothetical protein [Thermoanaerobaculia bacterium]
MTAPAAAPAVDASNPYPGLLAFGEADRAYFHGRTREREELFRLVRRETLTVVFGRSGLGKTSLLNAGLFPLLRQAEILPVPIRLDFTAGKGDLVGQVRAAVAQALRGQQVDAPPPAPGETLWEYFHKTPFWSRRNQLLTPLLAFDQFEEIFTLGRKDARVEPLLGELADLIENHIPAAVRDRMARTLEELPFSYERQKVRVVVSLREDFLPQLEGLRPRIPSLAGNRFRLLQMDGHQALDAILKPGGGLVGEAVAREILRFVAGASREDRAGEAGAAPAPSDDDLAEMEVEPALLSLFCRELNSRRQRRGLPAITAELVQGSRGEILSSFYDQCLADMARPVRTFIEERLLTGSGFRQSVPLEEALQGRGLTAEDLGKLVDRRLLRLEDRLGRPHVELIHDVMTPVIRESRDRRRAREGRRRLLARVSLAAGAAIAALLALAVFSLHESRLKAEAVAQRVRADRQRTEADRQRAEADRQRAKAEGYLATAREQRSQAQRQRVLADEQRVEAQRQRVRAEEQRGLADEQRVQAQQQRARSEEYRAKAEEMVSYLLFDLRDQLVPKGKLDIVRATARKALDYLSKVEKTDESERMRGVALVTLGDISLREGDTAEAEKSLAEALAIHRALHDKDPANRDWQNDLAIDLEKTSGLLRDRGDFDAANERYFQALSLWNELAKQSSEKDDPPQSHWRRVWIGAALGYADLMSDRVALSKPLSLCGTALRLLEDFAAKDAANVELKSSLAGAYRQQGLLFIDHGDVQAALQSYRKALELHERLVQESPGDVTLKADLAQSRLVLAEAELMAGRHAQALAMADSVAGLVRPYVSSEALASSWSDLLAYADGLAGDALLAKGDAAAALVRYAASRAIWVEGMKRAPDQVRHRTALSWNHFRTGNAYERRGASGPASEEWGKAVEIISPLVKIKGPLALNSNDTDLLDTYVRPLLSLGRFDEARPVCRKLQEREWDFLGLQKLCRGKGLLP